MNAPVSFDALDDYEPPEEAVDERLRKRTRLAYWLIGALALGFLLLSALLQVGGAVIGAGEVAVETSVETVSHPSGGVIAQVLVRDGDRVREGQILMRFDTAVSAVGSDSAATGLDQLLARQARLEAERNGDSAIVFPPELTASSDPQVRALLERETRLFRLRLAERSGSIALLDQRIRQYETQISSYGEQIAAIDQQRVLLEGELTGMRELYKRQLVTLGRLNQLESALVQLDGRKAALVSSIAETRARIAETGEQKLNVDKTMRSEAGTELAAILIQINDQKFESADRRDRFERGVVRAPRAGVIDKLAFKTIGSAVPAAQPILQIVPDSERLIVTARVRPQDVDQIKVGQPTRVVLSGLNRQTTPDLPGTLTFISAEVATDERSGQSFYRIKVAIDSAALKRNPEIVLRAGMPAEVFVQTGDRSILSYLLKPLTDQLRYALREE